MAGWQSIWIVGQERQNHVRVQRAGGLLDALDADAIGSDIKRGLIGQSDFGQSRYFNYRKFIGNDI